MVGERDGDVEGKDDEDHVFLAGPGSRIAVGFGVSEDDEHNYQRQTKTESFANDKQAPAVSESAA